VLRRPRAGCKPYRRLLHALGRLAIDRSFQGRRLGAALLWDAANRALRSEIGVVALAVGAKDDQAEAFYRHHGFVALGGDARRLVLPLATVAKGG